MTFWNRYGVNFEIFFALSVILRGNILIMRSLLTTFFILIASLSFAQMLNDTPFNAIVSSPKYSIGKGPKVLIDAGHHNFIVEMGLAKPLIDLATNDGYRVKVDSLLFTSAYLANYNLIVIMPAMPFQFGSKEVVTDEITFTTDELNALHNWVNEGGRLLMFSEHAPIDKSVTPLFNKFGIQLSIGIVADSNNCDPTIKMAGYQALLKFTKENGLLNMDHPIVKGMNKNEMVINILGYGGSALTGEGYANIFKLSNTSYIRKWNGSLPSGSGNSQCLAGAVGKGKLVAMGDCNGFTAMYINSGGKKFSAGMQVKELDWKQFVLNTLHWLSL